MSNVIIPGGPSATGIDPRLNSGNHLMWIATYRDNQFVNQYDKTGKPRSFGDLPRQNLKKISLVTVATGKLIASQDFIPGMSPFYRQRNLLTQGKGQTNKVHLLGWAIWDGKRTAQNLHVAFINERTFEVEMGHFVEGSGAGFKYPIKLDDYDYQVIAWDK